MFHALCLRHAHCLARDWILGLIAFALLAIAPPGSAASSTEVLRSLEALGAGAAPIRLTTWRAAYTVKLPLSPREALTGAKLHLDFVNSSALIRARSALSVRLNGRILKQFPLDPVEVRQAQDVLLPAHLLKVGYNDLEIGVDQHYTYDCEDPGSPELWTEIDTRQSHVTFAFEGLNLNLAPKLSQLGVAFDKRAWFDQELAFVVGTDRVTVSQVRASSLVAQGLSLRKGFGSLSFKFFTAPGAQALQPREGRLPGLSGQVSQDRDIVLVGRKAELSRYLNGELYEAIDGPFVGIYPLEGGRQIALVVSGNTDDEVISAARALANPLHRFSDVAQERLVTRPSLLEAGKLLPGSETALSAQGFRTSVSQGHRAAPIDFEFNAPADFSAESGEYARLKLHFSYGAGLREDSSLAISLNGNFVSAIALNNGHGEEHRAYEVNVPAKFIRAGFNTLSFKPVFVGYKGRCQPLRDDGYMLTLFEDSVLKLPASTENPQAPDLARFSAALWPHHQDVQLYLPAQDSASVVAALVFSAQMSRIARANLDIEVLFDPPVAGHVLIVGPAGAVPPEVMQTLKAAAPNWSAEGQQLGFLQSLEGGRVFTAVLATTGQSIESGLSLMANKGYWFEIYGRSAILDPVSGGVLSSPAAEPKPLKAPTGLLRPITLLDVQGHSGLAAGLISLTVAALAAFVLNRKSALRKSQHLKDLEP